MDVMKIARARQTDLRGAISERETEINEMKEEIETLDMFLKFGDELMQESKGDTPATASTDNKTPAASKDDDDSNVEVMMPTRQPA